MIDVGSNLAKGAKKGSTYRILMGNEVGSNSVAVNCAAAFLQSEDNVHSGDRLSFGVLAINGCILDHNVQEIIHEISGFIIDGLADPLDPTPSGEPPDAAAGDGGGVVSFGFSPLH